MDGTNPRRRLSILDRGGADPADARRVHLVGIGGSGMRSLADVLAAAGWTLSGSDANREALDGLPFAVRAGHASEAIDARLEMVVYSDAVARGNVELLRARELGIETLSYPQMLGRLFAERSGVAVAGTHGKSTTTAMAGEILATAGLDPTVICGAAPLGRTTGGRLGGGRWLVAEACEYRANFRFLKPRLGVILGIEADHFDCFGSKRELEAAFAEFAQALPADGVLLVRADCPATRSATADVACACESFGLSAAATWRATELRERRGLYWLRIRCRDRLVCDVKLRRAGRPQCLQCPGGRGVGQPLGRRRQRDPPGAGAVSRAVEAAGAGGRGRPASDRRRLCPPSDGGIGIAGSGAADVPRTEGVVRVSAAPGLADAKPVARICPQPAKCG